MIDLDVDSTLATLDGLIDLQALTAPGKVRIRSALGDSSLSLVPNRPENIADWGERMIRLGATTSDRSGQLRLISYQRMWLDTVVVMASTPTDDDCVISAKFARSDQRVLEVPCPHCGEVQELLQKVGNKDGAGLKYLVDPDTGRVTDVWYLCANEA